jgi:glutathione peroxidase
MIKRAKILAPLLLLALSVISGGEDLKNRDAEKADTAMATDYLHVPFNTITGEKTSLADFKGKVLLLVNVASRCGNTPQYAGLAELYRKYKDKGFAVIGFPANNFANQEPGTNEQILEFCTSTYDVTFPMMAKISVKGDDIHPLYKYLTTESDFKGDIKWNFTKFLLDRKGKPAARFETPVQPLSDEIVKSIEKQLQ